MRLAFLTVKLCSCSFVRCRGSGRIRATAVNYFGYIFPFSQVHRRMAISLLLLRVRRERSSNVSRGPCATQGCTVSTGDRFAHAYTNRSDGDAGCHRCRVRSLGSRDRFGLCRAFWAPIRCMRQVPILFDVGGGEPERFGVGHQHRCAGAGPRIPRCRQTGKRRSGRRGGSPQAGLRCVSHWSLQAKDDARAQEQTRLSCNSGPPWVCVAG